MKKKVVDTIKSSLSELDINLSEEDIDKLIEIPPNPELGDFAFPCFSLAKIKKAPPQEIAVYVREKIGNAPDGFSEVRTQGPYVNFFTDRIQLAKKLVQQIKKEKENFGRIVLQEKKKVMVEFSQPNTHKAFHVGHIRGTSIGESLARILEFSGLEVIRANYSGDTGMHIAKWIWCYNKYHKRQKLKKDESWIASIYVDAVKRLNQHKTLQKEVDEINRKIETKEDKEINKLWEKTRKLSIDSWSKIYEQLNAHFDIHYFESEMEIEGKKLSEYLLNKGIAKKSEDAVIMDLKEFNLGVWVLLRKDGTVLYSAKDLALAEKKFRQFDLSRSIVVVGDEQKHHFEQLKKALELMKFKNQEVYDFIPFGMVRLPTGKMSSRTGDNILYSDFIEEVIKHSKSEIMKRDKKLSDKKLNERSIKISVASIKYAMLKQSPNKNIVFVKEDALDFEGNTGPYLLYSYARANSITKKIKKPKSDYSFEDLEKKEAELILKLNDFPSVINKSLLDLNPSYLANYSYQLAQIFNEFYHSCQVINSNRETFRTNLVLSFKQVLKNSLNLLGIEVVEEM